MSPPPSTPIFLTENGAPMQIYVAVNDIPDRPKLIRTIKKHGGQILAQVQLAHVILVAPSSSDGRQLVRFRGALQPVLGYQWVNRCLKHGRVLGHADKWDDCLVKDDGLPISDDMDEDQPQNEVPLPTPRGTPVAPVEMSPTRTSTRTPNQRVKRQARDDPGPSRSQEYETPTRTEVSPPQVNPTNTPFNPNDMSQFVHYDPSQKSLTMTPQAMMFMQMFTAFQQSTSMPAMNFGQPSALPTISAPAALPSAQIYGGSQTQSPPHHTITNSGSPPPVPRLPVRSSSSSSSSKPIFAKSKGKPLKFYVQIDMKERNSVVSKIKKHGGVITSETSTADYAVLHNSSITSSSYDRISKGAFNAGIPAVKAAFVFESVAQGCLLDPTPWLHQPAPVAVKRRHRRKSSDSGKRARPRLSSSPAFEQSPSAPETTTPTPAPPPAPAAAVPLPVSAPTPVHNSLPTVRNTPSPTPPPENSRVLMATGKYKYTEEEREYALRYSEYLLSVNPSMTYTELSVHVASKMPHHPQRSWAQHLTTGLRDSLDEIRKRAGINHRKVQHQQIPQSVKQEPNESDTPLDAYTTDLNVFCNFFIDGHAEGISDDQVYETLAQQTKCRSEPSWRDFFTKHHDIVYARCNNSVD